jgi:HlyD family secretion protein
MKTPLKRLPIAVLLALLAAMGLAAGWLLLRQPPLPDGLIQANGRIE